MAPALGALCEGLAADAVALLCPPEVDEEAPVVRAATGPDGAAPSTDADRGAHRRGRRPARRTGGARPGAADRGAGGRRARPRPAGSARAGRMVELDRRASATTPSTCSTTPPARSRLAVEREEVESAQAEAATLRRSQRLQREFLSHLSHELRTPLTAIHGYASTLRQPDVTWDAASEERFLGLIEGESARMGRLVADMLDSSTMEAGGLRLDPHWCDLGLAIEAAVACVPGGEAAVKVEVAAGRPERVGRPRPPRAGAREPDRQRAAPRSRGGPVEVAASTDDATVSIRRDRRRPGAVAGRGRADLRAVRAGRHGHPGAGLGLAICRGHHRGPRRRDRASSRFHRARASA